jgi:hypothetical protein
VNTDTVNFGERWEGKVWCAQCQDNVAVCTTICLLIGMMEVRRYRAVLCPTCNWHTEIPVRLPKPIRSPKIPGLEFWTRDHD